MPKLLFAVLIAAIPLAALGQTLPSPAPAVTSSPLPTASPVPMPTPLVLPPDAPPQILAIAIHGSVFHSGDTFSATVVTSTNVPAVELRILGKVIRFRRTDSGIWQLSYKLPHIPRRFLQDYAAEIVAWNTTNLSAKWDLTISLR